MATYVLVHGAWVGGWCWHKVVPMLEAEGHRVVALDLPGHGDDRTAVSEMTLDANVARIRAAIDAAEHPVILVGHSMGGDWRSPRRQRRCRTRLTCSFTSPRSYRRTASRGPI